jgi:general nucleoside transport system permease protein
MRAETPGPPRWVLVVAAFAMVLGLSAAFLGASGIDVSAAGQAFLSGSFGSSYAVFSATLVRSVPLMLTGLAVAWAFNAGVFNIGVEGQFLVGAAAATAVSLQLSAFGLLAPLAAMIAGCVAGAGWAAIAAWLRVRFAVLEVISTIMLNFVAIQLVAYLVHGPLGDPSGIYPQSPSLPPATWLPRLVPESRLHLGFVIAVLACAAGWYVLRHRAPGFRLRLVGANPNAAWIAGGVRVNRVTVAAFLVSGAIGGLAGAIEVTGVTYALYESISPGYGYTAIAVALLANLNPAGVIASGIGFGALEAGAASMQRDASVPSVIVWVVEALLILFLAALQIRLQSRAVVTAQQV